MRTFRRRRRGVALLLIAVYLPACHHTFTPEGLTPAEYITTKHPKQVRVTLADQSWCVFRDPWVVGDTLGGIVTMFGSAGLSASAPAEGVPLGSVVHFEVHQANQAATIVLVVLGVAVVGAAIGGLVALHNWDFMGP
jgi:hypothetical protein